MATATTTSSTWPDAAPVEVTSDEFLAMIEAGVYGPDRRVFLWGGRIFELTAKTIAHAIAAFIVAEAVRTRLTPDWLIWPENPVQLDERHAPLPDIAVIRGPIQRYATEGRHPRADDVGLIVEISVTSLPKDLGNRAEKYARALVPRYWVADVRGRRIVEHGGPEIESGVGKYAHVKTLVPDDEIALILDGLALARIDIGEFFS